MPPLYRYLFALPAVIATLSVNATSLPDTTSLKKNIQLHQSNPAQSMDRINEIRHGIDLMATDSVAQGVRLMASGLQKTFAITKADRVMDFNGIELVNLIKMLDEHKLSDAEQKLGFQMICSVFKEKIDPNEKNLEPYLKGTPNTLFVKRIRLLIQNSDRKVENMLDGLLKEYPDMLSFNILKAELNFQQEKYAAASDYCAKAIAIWPSYAYAYNLKARSEGKLEKYDLELEDENKAISYYDTYADAWYYKAAASLDLDKYREAISSYRKAGELYPDYEYTNYFLAKSYKYSDNADSALYFINQHIRQYPDDQDGYDLKGDLYYNRDDYPAAIEYYDQAIKISPKNASFYDDRGNAYFYWKKIDTALNDFKKATELDKKDYYAFERMGDCYYNKEDYQTSIQYHQKALKIDPNYKYAWMSLEDCNDKLGNHDLCIQYCKKALAIDSTYATALGDLGWEYYCTGHYNECIDYSYRCLKHDETATYAMFNIALATLRKGDASKARELYKHFFDLCNEKKYEMTGGAVTDLRDLIKAKVEVDQAKSIIQDIFGETP